MIPIGIEVRPDLQLRSDMLAFGFTGDSVAEQTVFRLLDGDFVDHILAAVQSSPPSVFVVDMRNVRYMSSSFFGRLVTLNKRLKSLNCKLAIVVLGAEIREIFAITRFDKIFLVATDEAELRQLVGIAAPISSQSPNEQPSEFSRDELQEMEAAGITLNDAIRVVESLRP